MSGPVVEIAVLLTIAAVIALVVVRRRSDPLFAAYAKERGMTLISSSRARLPGKTPLLRKGERRYAERLLEGPLAGGPEGRLANYTYVEGSGSSEVRYRFTVAYTEVPESVPVAPELFLRPRTGPRALDDLEDAFAGPRSRVELESTVLSRSHEIFASEMQDQSMLRQLFSPSFVLWLIEEAPESFGFELFGGKLCCFVDGHAADAEALDWVATACAAVATRLRGEARENAAP